MPTGYTYKVQEGKTVDFKEFALDCARAFGALASMRDEPSDAEIPEKLKVDDYYYSSVEKARAEVEEWTNISDEDAETRANGLYSEERVRIAEKIDEKHGEKQRYEDMIEKVKVWEPPTQDHVGLKKFMLEQLQSSMDSDTNTDYYEQALEEYFVVPSGHVFKHRKLKEAVEWLERSEKMLTKAEQNIADKNKWINDLRNSL